MRLGAIRASHKHASRALQVIWRVVPCAERVVGEDTAEEAGHGL
jgi:hypothetical protein